MMKKKIQNLYDFFYSVRSIIYIILLCVVIIILSTKGITDESVVSMQGDMPKYLMNGVYVYDLLKDLPITSPLEHAYRYFARYPALSLGHHPILPGVAVAPFYALFGISVFSARLSTIFFMLLASIIWFLLVRSLYDETVAFLSSLVFVTTPFIVIFLRVVMSEIPTLSLIIVSTYLVHLYCESDKKLYVFAAAVSLSLSIYAKHTAVFMFPVLLFYLLMKKGARKLIEKEVIISYTIIGLLLLPLVLATLKFSHATLLSLEETTSTFDFLYYLKMLWWEHLTLPILILSLVSILISAFQRDKRAIMFFLWIVSCYLVITYLGYQRARYAIYWIPPYCLFAPVIINYSQSHLWKVLGSSVLIAIAGYQFAFAFRTDVEYANGYEQAAKYVVENRKGESVMFSGVSDTSYFIFFVRKHDPARELIVLRSDKILATSEMDRIIKENISSREEIYEILKNYGVGYVVIEDMESESRSLEWLRQEVKSEKFILRKKIILRSSGRGELSLHSISARKLNEIPLLIYEYKDYTPAKEKAILDINIPLMGDSIRITFGDLLPQR